MDTHVATLSKLPKGPRNGVRFNGRLSELLSEKHGRQAQVARAAGVVPSTVKRLAEGNLGCNPVIAQQIADALGEPLESLVISS